MSAKSESTTFGRHEVRYEADTATICVIQDGSLDKTEAIAMHEAIGRYAGYSNPADPIYILADSRKAGSVNAEARRILADTSVARQTSCIAVFGASFATRVVFNLLMKAVSLSSSVKVSSIAVASEAEARAWLAEKRLAHSARAP